MRVRERHRSRSLPLLLILLAFCLAGPSGPAFGSTPMVAAPAVFSPAPIMGALLPLTGALSIFGTDMANAVQLVAEQVNTSGGIRGTNLTVHVADTGSSPTGAQAGAADLIQNKGVQAIVGGASSGETFAASQVTEPSGVVLMSPSATSAILSASDSNDSLWRTTASDRLQGKVAASLSYSNLGYRRIGVLAVNNPYGNAIRTPFQENFTLLGGTVPIVVLFNEFHTDYTSELTTLFATNPEAVYLIAYPYDGTTILHNWWSNHAAWPTQWIMTEVMDDQATMDNLRSTGVNTTGFVGLNPVRSPATTGTDAYERYRAAYVAQFGANPVILSENAYDSAFVLALAMHASGSTNPAVFRTALRYVANPPGLTILAGQWAQAIAALDAGQNIDYWGAANRVDFDAYGDTGVAYGVWSINATGSIVAGPVLDEPIFWTPAAEGFSPSNVQIASPAAGAFVSRVVAVSGTANGSGIVSVEVRVDGGSWQNATGTLTWTFSLDTRPLADGSHQIGARSYDGTNYSGVATVDITVDNTPPSLSIDRPQPGGSVASSFSATWFAADPRSGLDHFSVELDANPARILPGSASTTSFANVPDGVHTLSIQAFDHVGNVRQVLVAFTVDGMPPATAVTVFGTSGQAGWFTSGVTLLLASTDSGAGVKAISVRVGANPFANYTAPIAFQADGKYTLDYYATDLVGNLEGVHTVEIAIDTTPPDLKISPPPGFLRQSDVTVEWTATDATSGIARYEVSVDTDPYESVGLATSRLFLLSSGEHTIHVRAFDAAGLHTERTAHVIIDANVFSFTGPYGGAPTIVIPLVIAATAFVIWRRMRQRRRGRESPKETDEGPAT